MQIIVGGAGKAGTSICHGLSMEGHNVTVIDTNQDILDRVMATSDVNTLEGSITSLDVLNEAEVPAADVFVAATSSDEVNITAAIFARQLGAGETVARVRDTEYARHTGFMRDKLGISYLMNPEYDTARHLAEMLQFPAAFEIEHFIFGNVAMIEGALAESSRLAGLNLIQFRRLYPSLIMATVSRNEETTIPGGDFVLEAGDRLLVTGGSQELGKFYREFANAEKHFKKILLVGGGRITYYLLGMLQDSHLDITLVEKDEAKANRLAVEFPNVRVIVRDGTDYGVLDELHVEDLDFVFSLTGQDEQNIMISLYAAAQKVPRTITKVNRTNMLPLLASFDLQTIITPHGLAAEGVMRFIRARQKAQNSSVDAVYSLMNNQVHALEFNLAADCGLLGIPISELNFHDNTIIAFIYRHGQVIFPAGHHTLQKKDRVAFITKDASLTSLEDLIEKA